MAQELTKQSEANLTLTEKLHLHRSSVALILDTSGSMNSDCEPGLSKIQALRNIVQSLPQENNFWWFNTNFGNCTKDTIPNPSGSTYLGKILQHLQNTGQKNAVVITDGDISDKALTISAVKGMNLKIMYVGSGNRPAFLDTLAKACGGFATTEDLKQTKQLAKKIQLLLGPTSQQARGAYEL